MSDFNDNLRSRIITPEMINNSFNINNGNKNKLITIKADHVGFRLGDIVHSKATAFYKKRG
jgi:ribosomal protein S19